MERRLSKKGPSAPLPGDYLKLVAELFNTNFDSGLKALEKIRPERASFNASGSLYPDEIVLCISLIHEGQMAATSVYGSVDFDPGASSPTVEDLLAACVDAIGSVYGPLLDPKKPGKLEQIADETLSALEGVPFEWTEVEVDRRKVHVRIDKANPKLDELADEWLKKNDPELQELESENQKVAEKLFVTGPKNDDGSDTVH